MFHSMTAEGKKEFRKKLFYFELKNFISIPCVIFTHGNENNVKKVLWRMTFIIFRTFDLLLTINFRKSLTLP